MTTKKITFMLPAETVGEATQALLLGEFNNWNVDEGIYLQKQEDGSMVAELQLTAGKTYQYRYLLNDGRWVNDNGNKAYSELYGHIMENCVVAVVETQDKKTVAVKNKVPKKEKPVSGKSKSTLPAKVKNDLTKIEGIGRQIESILKKEGIINYALLGKTSKKKLKEILSLAGPKFSMHNPGSWPRQAKLAAAEKWDELAILQQELKGGK